MSSRGSVSQTICRSYVDKTDLKLAAPNHFRPHGKTRQ